MLHDTYSHVKKPLLNGLNACVGKELLNSISTIQWTVNASSCMTHTENQTRVQGRYSGGTSFVPFRCSALVTIFGKGALARLPIWNNTRKFHQYTTMPAEVLCPFATVDIQSLFSHPKFCQVRFNVSAISPWNALVRRFASKQKYKLATSANFSKLLRCPPSSICFRF